MWNLSVNRFLKCFSSHSAALIVYKGMCGEQVEPVSWALSTVTPQQQPSGGGGGGGGGEKKNHNTRLRKGAQLQLYIR